MEEGNETGIFLSLFKGLFTVIESDINGDRLFLVLWKSHGRSSFSQVSPPSSHLLNSFSYRLMCLLLSDLRALTFVRKKGNV